MGLSIMISLKVVHISKKLWHKYSGNFSQTYISHKGLWTLWLFEFLTTWRNTRNMVTWQHTQIRFDRLPMVNMHSKLSVNKNNIKIAKGQPMPQIINISTNIKYITSDLDCSRLTSTVNNFSPIHFVERNNVLSVTDRLTLIYIDDTWCVRGLWKIWPLGKFITWVFNK